MYNDKFVKVITNTGNYRPYSTPQCYEASGKSFSLDFGTKSCKLGIMEETLDFSGEVSKYICTKCADNAYLIGFNGDNMFLDTAAGSAVFASGNQLLVSDSKEAGEKYARTDELVGWKTTLYFAPGLSVVCEFGKDSIRYNGGELSIESMKLKDSMYLVNAATSDGQLTLVFDTARFLFYGILAGKTGVGGYIDNIID